jgi:hypothetical protein
MPGQGTKVAPLFMIGGGAILLWSGITGKQWSAVLKDLIQGKSPKNLPSLNVIAPTTTTSTGGALAGMGVYGYSPGIFPGNPPIGQISGKSNQGIAQSQLGRYGWGAGEMIPLIALWTRESGWNPLARNDSSGAFGIAQALGHGQGPATAAPNGTNEYGGYGLTPAEARAANEGNPEYQIIWGLNYIKQTYGTPSGAWAHETSAGWY